MDYIERNSDGNNWSAPVQARPLGDAISMKGHEISYLHNNAAYRYMGAFDGRYIWMTHWGNVSIEAITKFDVVTGEYADYPTEGAFGAECVSYAGRYLWMTSRYEKTIVRIDPLTGTMTGFTFENGVNGNVNLSTAPDIRSMVYDGQFVWMLPLGGRGREDQIIIRLNPDTGTMTGIPLPSTSQFYYYLNYDGKDLWVCPRSKYDDASYRLIRLVRSGDTISNLIEYPMNSGDTGNINSIREHVFNGIHCAFGYVWLLPNSANRLVRFDIQKQTFAYYHFQEGINGNHNMGDITETDRITCNCMSTDGRHLWLFPDTYGRLIRIDPVTGTMRGYEFEGEDLGSKPSTSTYAACFDGNSIWSIPAQTRTRLIQITGDTLSYSIAEKYISVSGKEVALPSVTWITAGEDYKKSGPAVDDYEYLGYRIDDGELVKGNTATIEEVRENHEVYFVYYSKNEPKPEFTTITHQYRTESGAAIRPDTTHSAPIGQDYTATRTIISDHTYQGYRLDGGALQAGTTATIPDVQDSHTITFVYKMDDGGTEPGGDGKCCCCCKPNVYIYGDINVDKIETLNLFGCGSDCRDSDCKPE